MNALKCDRCKRYYDYDPTVRYNYISFGHKDIIPNKKQITKDICPECMEKFIDWLENPEEWSPEDRINELERAYKASNDDKAKLVEYYQREIKKFEAENEKLKLDCEKLQHGYVDIDNVPSGHWDGDILDIVFLPGRAYGKQYKTLVEMFKKIDQKKVDAAYKEAYNTELPIWQKEVLKQMYGVYKESKEKTELPRTLDINGTVYRKSIQIKDFSNDQLDSLIEGSRAFTRKFDNEWYYRIPTKREEMWDNILACEYELSKYVKVKKEDLETFAKECNEKKIFNIIGQEFHTQEYWFDDDSCIFQIFRKPAGFICAERLCYVFKDTIIDYLPPMRWDLFKKGRLAVKVTYNNYKEFYEACEKELGKKPSGYPMLRDDVTISICKKDGNFEIFTMEDQKKTGRKIVDWEDVR